MTEISRRQFLRGASASVVIPLTPNVVWWFEKWFGRQQWKANRDKIIQARWDEIDAIWNELPGELERGIEERFDWERTLEIPKDALRDPKYDEALAQDRELRNEIRRVVEGPSLTWKVKEVIPEEGLVKLHVEPDFEGFKKGVDAKVRKLCG